MRSTVLLLAPLLMLVGVSGAPADDTRDIGGTGGGEFRSECDDGWVLTGIEYTADAAVRTAGVRCGAVVDGRLTGENVSRAQFGYAPGPIEDVLRCPRDTMGQWLAGDVRDGGIGGLIRVVELYCVDTENAGVPLNGRLETKWATIVTRTDGSLDRQRPIDLVSCPDGMVATGIKGRAAAAIDALGLICSSWANYKPDPGALGGVRIVKDIDIYADKDLTNKLGELNSGTPAVLVAPCAATEDRCNIQAGGFTGWVYNGADYRSLELD